MSLRTFQRRFRESMGTVARRLAGPAAGSPCLSPGRDDGFDRRADRSSFGFRCGGDPASPLSAPGRDHPDRLSPHLHSPAPAAVVYAKRTVFRDAQPCDTKEERVRDGNHLRLDDELRGPRGHSHPERHRLHPLRARSRLRRRTGASRSSALRLRGRTRGAPDDGERHRLPGILAQGSGDRGGLETRAARRTGVHHSSPDTLRREARWQNTNHRNQRQGHGIRCVRVRAARCRRGSDRRSGLYPGADNVAARRRRLRGKRRTAETRPSAPQTQARSPPRSRGRPRSRARLPPERRPQPAARGPPR